MGDKKSSGVLTQNIIVYVLYMVYRSTTGLYTALVGGGGVGYTPAVHLLNTSYVHVCSVFYTVRIQVRYAGKSSSVPTHQFIFCRMLITV
jgi:hypothetical protein